MSTLEHSVLRPHRPTAPMIDAVQVTRDNAAAVAREIGGQVVEDPKSSDPTDVAMWLHVPTLRGAQRLLITSEGPVVGRCHDNGRIAYWDRARDFYALYQPTTRHQEGTPR